MASCSSLASTVAFEPNAGPVKNSPGAEAELGRLHSAHRSPSIILGSAQRDAGNQLSALRVVGQSIAVLRKADEIGFHLHHLVEEVLVVLQIPGHRTVEEVDPDDAAADRQSGVPELIHFRNL